MGVTPPSPLNKLTSPADAVLNAVAPALGAAPVKSQDGSTVAFVTLDQPPSGGATLEIAAVSVTSGQIAARGTLSLSSAPAGSYVLVTPAFAPTASVLALVLSISAPVSTQTIQKPNPVTGQTESQEAVEYQTHHELAYFEPPSGSVTGPFPLNDAPSFPRVNAATDGSKLLVWTVSDLAYTPANEPEPVPQLNAYPVGSGAADYQVDAPSVWPVSGEPLAILASGQVCRLVESTTVEIYNPADGTMTAFAPSELKGSSTRPGYATMDALPAGRLLLTNGQLEVALIVDPLHPDQGAVSVKFDSIPADGFGRYAVLSADGRALYVGSGSGIAAFDVSTGLMTASHSDGNPYVRLLAQPDGGVVADTPSGAIGFFDAALNLVTHAESGILPTDLL